MITFKRINKCKNIETGICKNWCIMFTVDERRINQRSQTNKMNDKKMTDVQITAERSETNGK